jgi:hypothetical protein
MTIKRILREMDKSLRKVKPKKRKTPPTDEELYLEDCQRKLGYNPLLIKETEK